MRSKLGLSLTLAAVAGYAASTASADVSIFPAGAHAAHNFIPFGTVSTTQHQVFASTLFSAVSGGAPVTITDIGFAAGAVGTLNTNVTINLGYTTRAPGANSPIGLSIPTVGGGGTPNASGAMSAFYSNATYSVVISATSTTDFTVIHFPGAFVYDPSLGNLLVEIVNTTAATTVNEPVSRTAGDVTSSRAYASSTFGNAESPTTATRMQFTYTVGAGGTGACCLPNGSCLAGQTIPQCQAAGGVYQGTNSVCSGQCPQPGACCMPNGSCVPGQSAAQCTGAGGTYQGNGSTCTGQCPQPGACCKFDGSCIPNLLAAACTAQGGTFQGAGSACGNCPTVPPNIYNNCAISTGPTTLSGTAAPAGSTWSEVARDEVDPTSSNTVAGFTATGGFRMADNFTVPAGGVNLAYVKVYGYTSGLTTPSITAATLQIWNGQPGGGGAVIFGDTTTNRLANNAFSTIYRTFNTTSAPTCGGAPTAPGTTRRLQDVFITVNQFLAAGTYWIDYDFTGASFSPPSTQTDAIGRQCDPNNSNGLQLNAGVWGPMNDTGQGCVLATVQQDAYFELYGTSGASACYANCDSSTVQPCLNVQDFGCFLNKFASNDTYANCDNSTIAPVLNVQDFGCFLNKFASGCSSC